MLTLGKPGIFIWTCRSANQCQQKGLWEVLFRVFTLGLSATTLQRSYVPIFLPVSCDSHELLRSRSTENLSSDKMERAYIACAADCLQLFTGAWFTEWFPVNVVPSQAWIKSLCVVSKCKIVIPWVLKRANSNLVLLDLKLTLSTACCSQQLKCHLWLKSH